MKRGAQRTFPFAVVALAAACMPDTGGINPPDDTLIFPVGLATTKSDDYLLAVNSNFDLKYNAGTLVAFDLSILDSHLAPASDGAGPMYSTTCGDDGISSTSRDGQFCFVNDSALIREQETLRLGAFASDLEITPSGDRAVIPVRGDSAILLVDVHEKSVDVLSCGENASRRCDSAHEVTSSASRTLPIEPYEVAVLEMNETGPEGDSTPVTLGFASHVAGGQVSLFSISRGPVGSPVLAELLSVADGVVGGASGIAANGKAGEIYVAGRDDATPHVAVMEARTSVGSGSLTSDPWFNQTGHVNLASELYAGTDARGIAVSPDGKLAFLTTRTPDALVKMDVENYEFLDMTTVCLNPSSVSVFNYEGGTSDPADDRLYAFVMCFYTDQIYIVDSALMQSEVRATGAGPQAIAFDEKRELIYIANFRESNITVLQAVPPFSQLKDSAGRVVRIGAPRLPDSHD